MESAESDKENLGKARCTRTTKQQFDLMFEFHNENNVEVLDNSTYNQRWNDLTEKLNAMGPPTHLGNEWKRVWSERKYNKKRKRTGEGNSNSSYGRMYHMSTGFKLSDEPSTNQKLGESNGQNASTFSVMTNQQHHSDLPLDNLMQDWPMLFHDFYDQSYNSIDQIGATNTELDSNQPVLALPENPISKFVFDQPTQLNTDEVPKRLSEISKKLDIVIDLLVESNNLKKELLQKK